jgi:hypothetical protein
MHRPSNVRPRAVRAAFLAALIASSAAASATAAERVTVRGANVAIYNLAGKVEVVPGTGSEVVVEIARGGRDASDLELETGLIHGRSTLRVIYPSDRIRYPGAHGTVNGMHVARNGTWGDKSIGLGARRVTISNRGGGMEAWADLRILVPKGLKTGVWLGCGEVHATGVDAELQLDTHAGSVEASDIAGALNIDTGSGSVEVRGVRGDLLVDTGSGSVIVAEARGGTISLDTGSGSVEGTGLDADRVKVDTGSGSVMLSSVSAPDVQVDTGSGTVYLDLDDDVDNVLVDTGSGGVTLNVPPSLGARIDVETGSGGISSEIAMQSITRRHGELHGRIGDGQGRIVIDTGSGGVRLMD